MKKHPERERIAEAAQTNSKTLDSHLKDCEECRFLFDVYRKTAPGEKPIFTHAPEHWVNMAVAIPGNSRIKRTIRKLGAKIVYDSWVELPALSVRNMFLTPRRISIEFEDSLLEMQVTRKHTIWQFTAKFRGETPGEVSFLVSGSGTEIYPDDAGFFIWHEKNPPVQLLLVIDDKQIPIPKLSWENN